MPQPDGEALPSQDRQDELEKYRSLFANMTEGFALGDVLLDGDGHARDFRFLEVNEAFFAQTGFPRTIIGRPSQEWAPKQESSWRDYFCGVAQSGQPVRFENFNADSGRHYDVYCYCPQPGQFAIVFRDVSDRLRMEQALRQSEQRYLALFNNQLTAIAHCRIITDAAGTPVDFLHLRVNQAYEKIVGLTAAQIEGKRLTEAFPGAEHMEPNLVRLYGEVAQTGNAAREEIFFPHTQQWFNVFVYSHQRGEFTILFSDISERKRTEMALRQSESELNAAFEQSAIGFAHISPQGYWLRVNRRYCELLGYPEAELLGRHFRSLTHPDDIEAELVERERLHRGEVNWVTVEKRYLHRQGHPVWMRVTLTAVRDAAGAHLYNLVVAEDITESKRSRGEIEGFFRQAAVGMLVMDLDTRMLRVNQRLCDILGYTKDELQGMRYMPLNHPDDAPTDAALFRQLRDGEIPDYVMEKQIRRKDGGYIWVLISCALVREQDEDAPLAVVVIQDIQARKELEAELQQYRQELERRVEARTAELQAANAALRMQRERFRNVLETAADAYVAVDENSRIVEWNAAATALFGWSRDEALGLSLMETIIPERYREKHERGFRHFNETGQSDVMSHVLELPALNRRGEEFPVEITLNAIRAEGHWLINSFIRDISARKAAEAALQQAKENAESASRAKTEFLATMSHEIRTPLNGVIGFTGLLLDGPLTEDKRHYAELARQSGEALLHLLNDFLDFSKIEAGRLQLEPVDFDLHLEATQVLALVQPAAETRGLELRRRIDVPHRLRGDAARLRQILLNLLSNAVKFTEQGHVTLCCSEAGRQGRTVRICFEVTDTGIGIEPALRPFLFKPFVQAESITRRFGGTGLGLAISRRLAEAMGGEIGFRSSPGAGSTFWVELPFVLLPSEETPLPDASLDEFRSAPEGTHRGRVLVAEDNSVSQMLAAEVLKRLGCQVDVVGNGIEAVEAWKQLPYDLIFMDCDMPAMDGFEATRQIRRQEGAGRHGGNPHGGRPHTPIIAMTASALQGDAERCLAAGMDEFMSKPLRLQQISRVVETWLPPVPAAKKMPE
jgi:PAS domain S-box-containing protein